MQALEIKIKKPVTVKSHNLVVEVSPDRNCISVVWKYGPQGEMQTSPRPLGGLPDPTAGYPICIYSPFLLRFLRSHLRVGFQTSLQSSGCQQLQATVENWTIPIQNLEMEALEGVETVSALSTRETEHEEMF